MPSGASPSLRGAARAARSKGKAGVRAGSAAKSPETGSPQASPPPRDDGARTGASLRAGRFVSE